MSRFLVSSKFSLTVSTYEAYGLDDDAVLAVGEQDWWVEGLVPSVKKWQKPVLREACPGYRMDLDGGAHRQGMLKKQQKYVFKGRRSISMMNQAVKGTSYPFYSFFARKAWQKPWCTSAPTILKYFCSTLCQKNGIKKEKSALT